MSRKLLMEIILYPINRSQVQPHKNSPNHVSQSYLAGVTMLSWPMHFKNRMFVDRRTACSTGNIHPKFAAVLTAECNLLQI